MLHKMIVNMKQFRPVVPKHVQVLTFSSEFLGVAKILMNNFIEKLVSCQGKQLAISGL